MPFGVLPSLPLAGKLKRTFSLAVRDCAAASATVIETVNKKNVTDDKHRFLDRMPNLLLCNSRPSRANNYFATTNCGLLSRVPDGVTTETKPVVAPAGTVALM